MSLFSTGCTPRYKANDKSQVLIKRLDKDLEEMLQLIGEEQQSEIHLESKINEETMVDIM